MLDGIIKFKIPASYQIIFAIILLLTVQVLSRRFMAHDRIGLVANTVGPFNNPTETYPVNNSYYFLL
jgi:hypothetical protein